MYKYSLIERECVIRDYFYSCLYLLFRDNLLVQLQFERELFGDYFGLFQKSFVCFSCFDIGPKHRNKSKKIFWFRETNRKKTTETD
jgi:hypothetical protein